MRARGEIRTCEACGKEIRERRDGSGLRSHKCQHGHECVAPAFVHPKDGRTHNVPCLECARAREASKSEQSTELEKLVMDLAFAIEDPCGVEAIKLAGALVRFGQNVPEGNRVMVAQLLVGLSRLMPT